MGLWYADRATRRHGSLCPTRPAKAHGDVSFQVGAGLVDEDALTSYGLYGARAFWISPRFAEFWATERTGYHPDFVAAFEAEYDLAP